MSATTIEIVEETYIIEFVGDDEDFSIEFVEEAIELLELVEQGPRGAPGATLPPIQFAYNNVSPRTVHTLSANAVILSARLTITENFNGAGAYIKVGTAADNSLLMAETDSDLAREISFENDLFEPLPAGTQIIITTFPGAGGTSGEGFLILEIIDS
jgi:hypothetical protein